ncbi:hypothetical protein NP233_g358 [Leucocoprinus birnbaumii]|uniref:NACHT domain-containing protein n=1 Tax=Leucocoprinus birnbaumii TaxID=56174 RepID=A0AAD5YVV7_9AGAR|nr:hypothetical protein NP233_g358 [Leucocoprinus birnbaumii]
MPSSSTLQLPGSESTSLGGQIRRAFSKFRRSPSPTPRRPIQATQPDHDLPTTNTTTGNVEPLASQEPQNTETLSVGTRKTYVILEANVEPTPGLSEQQHPIANHNSIENSTRDATGTGLSAPSRLPESFNPTSSAAFTHQLANHPVADIHRPSNSFFNYAHSFRVKDSTFINDNRTIYPVTFMQNLNEGYAANVILDILSGRRVLDAEVDASGRIYAPRCHPGTRKELRERLIKWILDENRSQTLVWLVGPAGAGKSAVAQTFAEYCQSIQQLGASFFFSRLEGRVSTNGLVATIVYQLAIQYPDYQTEIVHILSRDRSILDKTLPIQFNKLIIEPMEALASRLSKPTLSEKPLLIVLDGLDECNDEVAQRQIVGLIGKYVQLAILSLHPLVWLLCSRPEWHIGREFTLAERPFIWKRENISCNSPQDIADVYCILKTRLQEVYNDFTTVEPKPSWPEGQRLRQISELVGGLPILADTIYRFIRDGDGTPDSMLDQCISYLATPGKSKSVNPLRRLDQFYQHTMGRVRDCDLPKAKLILAFYILSPTLEPLPSAMGANFGNVLEVARFLRLEKDTLYKVLRGLYSVVDVPSAETAHQKPLLFFHKFFSDFLQDPARAGGYALDMDQLRYDIAILTLRWHNDFLRSTCKLERCPNVPHRESWLIRPQHVIDTSTAEYWKNLNNLNRLKLFVRLNCWQICWNTALTILKTRVPPSYGTPNEAFFEGHSRLNTELLQNLVMWLLNPNRLSSFIWVRGPAGAGKTALADAFAEQCRELDQLGGVYFFSIFQRYDPLKGFIAAIAHQLAEKDVSYKRLLLCSLTRDPSILDKSLQAQFKELIIEPFHNLSLQYSAVGLILEPVVIIIDGLDECMNEDAQCKIVSLIAECNNHEGSAFPLLWVVFSRPTWSLQRTFASPDLVPKYERHEITVDAAANLADVYLLLKDGLKDITDKSHLPAQWPGEAKLQRLATSIGGLPILASIVLRFICDQNSKPDTQLDFCLMTLESGLNRNNPLEKLDAFYRQIIHRVPHQILSITKDILAFQFLVCLGDTPPNHGSVSIFEAARFLQIDKDTFCQSLSYLQLPVIKLPPREAAHRTPLLFFHKSFSDFLQDASRSQQYAIDLDQARLKLTILATRWKNRFIQSNCELQNCPSPAFDEYSLTDPLWIRDAKANG